MEKDSNADCDPLQFGLARLFCDVHCVRDAVVRGDREIITNVEAATNYTNKHLDALISWSHTADRAEFAYLDSVLQKQSQDILRLETTMKGTDDMVKKICGNDNPNIVCLVQHQVGVMQSALSGYAEASSFSAIPRASARAALEEFVKVHIISLCGLSVYC